MRTLRPTVRDGRCYLEVLNRRNEPITVEPTRDMGSILDALGPATSDNESVADMAWEYLTGHRCAQCGQPTSPHRLCPQCGVCRSCCCEQPTKGRLIDYAADSRRH